LKQVYNALENLTEKYKTAPRFDTLLLAKCERLSSFANDWLTCWTDAKSKVNHERLAYRNDGRDYRLTDFEGSIVLEVIA